MAGARDPELLWLVAFGVALGGWVWARRAPTAPPVADRAPTVMLVVLDTVRADHASSCGYGRPTTPTLDRLVEEGASLACDAVAPGSWTLPSHASYFTGEPVESHGAHFVPLDAANLLGAMQVRPLRDDLETLAEHFVGAGYTSLALSGNPVLTRSTGLVRGFTWWRSARAFGRLYGDDYIDALDKMLDQQAPVDKPLFLFLNIADAHQPWSPVPADVGWVPARGRKHPRMADVFQGRIPGAELADHFAGINDSYDHATWRASDTLARALAVVEEKGWADGGLRLVVVSDHGEFLGEHGLVDHGRYLWEPNQRVFLLHAWRGPGRPDDELRSLPRGLSALSAWHLTRNGRLPAAQGPVTAATWPDAYWQELSGGRLGTSMSAAVWSGDEKLVWQDGVSMVYDLAADPAEARPTPLPADHPLGAALEALVARVKADAAGPVALDPELVRQLQAAGYMGADDE